MEEGDNSNQYAYQLKSKISLWIFLGVFVGALLVVSIWYFGFNINKISGEELLQGKSLDLGEGKKVKFEVDGSEHEIIVDFVNEDSVDLTILSDPITINIKIGETHKIDLDNDGDYDLLIRLDSIVDGVPKIYIKEIDEEIEEIENNSVCEEKWICGNWSVCNFDRYQMRICEDFNECETYLSKPDLNQSCNYINETGEESCSDYGAVLIENDCVCTGSFLVRDNLICCVGDCIEQIKISDYLLQEWKNIPNSGECSNSLLAAHLDECLPYKCNSHNYIYELLSGEEMILEKGVIGLRDNLCHFYEEVPYDYDNKGEYYCQFNESERMDIATGYRDLIGAEDVSVNVGDGTYTIDGVEKTNYFNEAFNRGDCSITLPVMEEDNCDNDGKCEWDAEENFDNCPNDCLGDGDFLSELSCEDSWDCLTYYTKYNECFMGICIAPTKDFEEYLLNNYELTNCDSITCDNCEVEFMIFSNFQAGYSGVDANELNVEFCIECSNSVSPSFGWGCNEGYECYLGKCILE